MFIIVLCTCICIYIYYCLLSNIKITDVTIIINYKFNIVKILLMRQLAVGCKIRSMNVMTGF